MGSTLASAAGQSKLVFQGDGNLVVSAHPVHPPCVLQEQMQKVSSRCDRSNSANTGPNTSPWSNPIFLYYSSQLDSADDMITAERQQCALDTT